jgi:S-adenosylmethionine-diacylgycerolhomoserine-N-methlytransferase
MNVWGRLKTLYYLTLSPIRGETHEDRLESFYRHQAADYDAFREKMLHGRDELFAALPADHHASWVDLGAGTGRNAERFGQRLTNFASVELVDLSSSLLEMTRRRIADRGWSNVRAVHADATRFDRPDDSVDLVTCCYSLTMIPNWFAAIDNAWRMLKPGGKMGVVDFYVARKHPDDGRRRHTWPTRTFWPAWFASDNVFPSADHLPYLANRFEPIHVEEHVGKIPWLPLVRAPYYIFVGRKNLCGKGRVSGS